jgi:glycosyltransferase involved in cell wall biosynthesis
MKIAYDYLIFSLQSYGGISRYITRLASRLNCIDGITAKIIAPLHFNNFVAQLPRNLVSGKKISILPATTRLLPWINQVLYGMMLRRYEPDILHETYYSGTKNFLAGATNITTVYDMIHEMCPQDFSIQDHTTMLKLNSVKYADHVICISESTKRDLINIFGVDASKITVVYLGFDTMSINGYSSELEKPVIILEKPFVLFVGRREGYKNFQNVVRAYASSRFLNSSLKIISFGGGPFSLSELDFFKRQHVPLDSIFHVDGDDKMLSSLYRTASALVYPSKHEGFGFPPLESFSAGCPVACSNTSSIPEVVGDAAIMFDPNDSEEIAKSLTTIICDTAIRNRCIERGFERIKLFSWEKCAKETLEVYQKVS